MAMNDEETVALIAGGHTFGKTHGAGDPSLIGRSRKAARSRTRASAGRASTTPASVRTRSPAARKSRGRRRRRKWSNHFFDNLFGNEWELTQSPAGAKQWEGEGRGGRRFPTRSTRRRSTCRRC
jgi:catalase-peroxidase